MAEHAITINPATVPTGHAGKRYFWHVSGTSAHQLHPKWYTRNNWIDINQDPEEYVVPDQSVRVTAASHGPSQTTVSDRWPNLHTAIGTLFKIPEDDSADVLFRGSMNLYLKNSEGTTADTTDTGALAKAEVHMRPVIQRIPDSVTKTTNEIETSSYLTHILPHTTQRCDSFLQPAADTAPRKARIQVIHINWDTLLRLDGQDNNNTYAIGVAIEGRNYALLSGTSAESGQTNHNLSLIHI